MTRKVYHSVSAGNGWQVKSNGQTVSNHRMQATAEQAAVKAGHKVHDAGGLEQAVLHRANGTIREERTYGSDPRRTKG
jgi:hypothetical protein